MKKRNICILTQPLSNGYGGLLQAYALQTILRRMGHSVKTEDRKKNASNLDKCIYFLKSVIIYILYPVLTYFTGVYYNKRKYIREIDRNTDYFKNKYIDKTIPIDSNNKKKLNKYKFDTYIVGSDQVWRPRYSYGSGSIYNYFLDFTKGENVKRIAYAASFGNSEWEFSEEETKTCSELLEKFDAVSVREENGIFLCKKYFNVDAVQVLDPTLLLEKEDYISLVTNESEKHFKDHIFYYFLDSTPEKERIVTKISDIFNLSAFSIMPTGKFYQVGPHHLKECTFAPVTSWLEAYIDADFIITDSFHGTVFSIIFNKPFITIANKERGIDRFTSLLRLFDLTDRLIYSESELTDNLINKPINFDKVNLIKKTKQIESLSFLSKALS